MVPGYTQQGHPDSGGLLTHLPRSSSPMATAACLCPGWEAGEPCWGMAGGRRGGGGGGRRGGGWSPGTSSYQLRQLGRTGGRSRHLSACREGPASCPAADGLDSGQLGCGCPAASPPSRLPPPPLSLTGTHTDTHKHTFFFLSVCSDRDRDQRGMAQPLHVTEQMDSELPPPPGAGRQKAPPNWTPTKTTPQVPGLAGGGLLWQRARRR